MIISNSHQIHLQLSSSSPPARLQKSPLRGVRPNEVFLATTRKDGFFQSLGSLALAPRPPPFRALQLNFRRSGAVELNLDPTQHCGECGRSDTSKALQCKRCNRTFHHKCSGLSRTEVA